MSWLEVTQAGVAMVLIGASLALLPRAYRVAYEALARPRWVLTAVIAATALAAALRLGVPHRLSTIFIGYEWTRNAFDLYPIPRYGAGSLGLYHALFAILPYDHRSILAVNAALGVVTLPLAAAFFARFFDRPRYGALAAALIAVIPLFIRNDTSDAKNVPALLWLFSGLLLLHDQLAARRRPWLAVAPLTLAAVSRPEMPVFIVLVAGLVAALARPRRPAGAPSAWGPLAVGGALTAPHALAVAMVIESPEGRAGLPGWSFVRLAEADDAFLRWSVVADPDLFPIGLVALALAGFLLAPRPVRGRMLLLAAASGLGVILLLPDLDFANRARIEVPATLLFVGAAAAGLGALWGLARSRLDHALWAAAAVLGLATAIPTAEPLFRYTNADLEEDLIREAIAALPDEPLVLLRETRQDRDDLHTHVHFPDYLLPPEAELRSFADHREHPNRDGRPVFAYLGVRCYARFRPHPEAPPPGDNEQAHCRELRQDFALEPVTARAVRNRGDPWIGYYGRAPTFTVGLYRVGAARR